MSSLTKKLNNGGDTIVEVMIVLAVLGLAIGISYATANRSLISARQAQENSEATAYTQAQIERLRTLDTTQLTPVQGRSSSNPLYRFCIGDDNALREYVTTDPVNNCKFGDDNRYTVSGNYSSVDKKYTMTASWDDAAGQGTDTVTLVYRLDK